MPLWHNAIEPFEMYMRKWAEIGQKLGWNLRNLRELTIYPRPEREGWGGSDVTTHELSKERWIIVSRALVNAHTSGG